MESEEEIAGALLDVRKAYRLLYFFQKRVLSLVDQLSQKLGRRFYYWLPSGDNGAIMAATNPFDRSDWKMLPLLDAELLFTPDGDSAARQKGQWMLDVLVRADDGCPSEEDVSEPSPADFRDAADCRSTIYLCAYIALKDMERNWYYEVYSNINQPREDELPEIHNDISVVGFSVDLSTLSNRESIENVSERFLGMVKAAGGLV